MRTARRNPKAARRLDVSWSEQSWAVHVIHGQAGPARLADHALGWLDLGPAQLSLPRRCLGEAVCDYALEWPLLPPGLPWLRTWPGRSQRRNSLREPLTLQPPLKHPRRSQGFTLVEMLVVIGIIGILAGILLPALARMKTKGKVAQARTEMVNLQAAIKQYEAEYNRFPATKQVEANGNPDFTFAPEGFPTGQSVNLTNDIVMAILLNMDQGSNKRFERNPRQLSFFNARPSGDTSSPGLGTDAVLRDPWGSPYIITVDLNADGRCLDGFYRKAAVSRDPDPNSSNPAKGLNGLVNLDTTGKPNEFSLNSEMMIWSLGPDKLADESAPANKGANQDNVLSWK